MSDFKNQIRNELLDEIIAGYDQLIELFKTGGAAGLTGHRYNAKENELHVELLEQLKKGLKEMYA